MLQLQQLRVLVAVRDHGSLNAAAAALGYGVPTITHHLGALERHLDVELVQRDRRGARLTPIGTVLVGEAEQVLEHLARAERLVLQHRDRGTATIRVDTFASVGSQVLPGAIRRLRARSVVEVEVVAAEPTEVVERVRDGGLDAGLIYDSADDPAFAAPDLQVSVLMDEEYQVLVGQSSPYVRLGPVDLAELADAEWICSRNENETSDRVLRRACGAAGFDPRVLMRSDDLAMIHGLVAEGLGCTLVTPSAVDHRFDVTALHTARTIGRRRTVFAWRRAATPPAVDELHRILVSRLGA